MRVLLADYRSKGLGLRDVLVEAGHTLVAEAPLGALFVDNDVVPPRTTLIEWAYRNHAKAFVYQHSGHPVFVYDGVWTPHPRTTALLVASPGDKKLQESFGHDRPVVEIGWFYCEQKAFVPREVRNVLFAPLHPWSDGVTMIPADRDRNAAAFRAVLGLGVPVTVRYLGDLEANGLWRVPGVEFVQGKPDNSVHDIDRHDLVVGKETFAWMAVARGVPTIMFGQEHSPEDDEGRVQVKNWERYRDLVRFPFDLSDGPVEDVAVRASSDAVVVNAWRDEWIGRPLTVDRLPI